MNYNGKQDSYKFNDFKNQKYIPDLPLYISEFGELKWVPENAWGCGASETEDDFFTRYEEFVAALLEAPNTMGFCYTQLYDVEQEVYGLYTYDREKKFSDYSRITAANKGKAAIEDTDD